MSTGKQARKERVETLRKRAVFVRRLLEEKRIKPRYVEIAYHEIFAIDWAVPILEAYLRDHPSVDANGDQPS